MSLVKITFDGCSVTAKQDADINHYLGGNVPAGVIVGLGGQLKYTVANNYITFASGYVQIYGRRIYIEEDTKVYISLDSTKYGYVIIDLDISTDNATITKVETSSTYPTLIHDDFNLGGTRYQLAIAKYQKTTSSISVVSFEREEILSGVETANAVKENIMSSLSESLGTMILYVTDIIDSTTYKVNLYDSPSNTTLYCVAITGTVVTIPGQFMTYDSTFGFTTIVYGNEVNLTGEISEGAIIINTNDPDIEVKRVYAYRFGV